MCERERDVTEGESEIAYLSSSPLSPNTRLKLVCQCHLAKTLRECPSLSLSVSEQFLTKYFQSIHTDWI